MAALDAQKYLESKFGDGLDEVYKAMVELAKSIELSQLAEKAYGLYETALYTTFARRVRQSKWKLMHLLSDLKMKGHRIAGIGSPGRSSTV